MPISLSSQVETKALLKAYRESGELNRVIFHLLPQKVNISCRRKMFWKRFLEPLLPITQNFTLFREPSFSSYGLTVSLVVVIYLKCSSINVQRMNLYTGTPNLHLCIHVKYS